MPYIIDGYNLLRSVEKFESIDDAALCRQLDRFLRIIGQKGTIVFDGLGPPDKSGFNNLSYLEIVFSGQNKDADSIINNKVKLDTAPRLLTVVSSDREIRSAAAARKVDSIKSDQFWQVVQKQLNRKTPQKDPKEKHQGLNESETEHWMEIFGIDQNDE